MKRLITWLAHRFGVVGTAPMDRALALREQVDPEPLMLNPDGSIGIQGNMQLSTLSKIVDCAYCYRASYPNATGAMFAGWWYSSHSADDR